MEPNPLQQVDRTWVFYEGRKFSYFAGCDYFRLASHPVVIRALHQGVEKYGLNVAASRMTTGNHELYGKLEKEIAGFFGAPEALLVANGYATNSVVAQALKSFFSGALINEKAHPSLHDAARFLECPILKFKHRDPEDLSRVVARAGESPILLTDGLFSQDGEIAPLKEYLRVLPASGVVLVDDAHAAGVLGETGKGTAEHCGVGRSRIIQTITLSKAFGVYGGAVLCDRGLREKIVCGSSMFAGSTPLPLPLANAALASVRFLKAHPALRRRLLRKVEYAKRVLRERGIALPATPAPIISIVPQTAAGAGELKARLMSHRVFPSLIRYPGGPKNGYFRFTLSSEHTRAQIDGLLEALCG